MAQKLRVLWWKNKIQNQQNGDRKVAIFYTIEVRYFLKTFQKSTALFAYFALDCGLPAQITIILSLSYSRLKARYLSLFSA